MLASATPSNPDGWSRQGSASSASAAPAPSANAARAAGSEAQDIAGLRICIGMIRGA